MSKIRPQIIHTPNFSEFIIHRALMRSRLMALNPDDIFVWDNSYWYVSHEDWGKIIQDVLIKMPKYVANKVDCENMAFHASCRVNEKYQLNTMGIAIGDSPMGYHGFNIFLSDVGLYFLEPQTGEVFKCTEDSGYKAKIIIMG